MCVYEPVGGVANAFVKLANEQFQGVGVEFQLHVSGGIDPMDESDVEPPIVSVAGPSPELPYGVRRVSWLA